MNILVTGASGYIGNYVVKQLLNDGHNVDVVSRSDNSFIKEFSEKITVYFADITKPFDFQIKNINYDVFIHLAAANDVDSLDPEFALKASVLGTRYALDFCEKQQIKKIIYFSTFQVYGYLNGNMTEKSDLLPTNDYGITHFFAEQYLELYQRTKNINFIILRPTNVYGAPMYKNIDRWSLVPSCFCKEAFNKGEINIMSSGLQRRDFVCVNDLAKATSLLCSNFDSFINRKINISSGIDFPIIEIAKLVANVYKDIFSNNCLILTHSDNPKNENVFNICKNEVSKLGIDFGKKEQMRNEIIKIFNLLK